MDTISYFYCIPADTLVEIFSYLHQFEIVRIFRVCKLFKTLGKSKKLWEKIVFSEERSNINELLSIAGDNINSICVFWNPNFGYRVSELITILIRLKPAYLKSLEIRSKKSIPLNYDKVQELITTFPTLEHLLIDPPLPIWAFTPSLKSSSVILRSPNNLEEFFDDYPQVERISIVPLDDESFFKLLNHLIQLKKLTVVNELAETSNTLTEIIASKLKNLEVLALRNISMSFHSIFSNSPNLKTFAWYFILFLMIDLVQELNLKKSIQIQLLPFFDFEIQSSSLLYARIKANVPSLCTFECPKLYLLDISKCNFSATSTFPLLKILICNGVSINLDSLRLAPLLEEFTLQSCTIENLALNSQDFKYLTKITLNGTTPNVVDIQLDSLLHLNLFCLQVEVTLQVVCPNLTIWNNQDTFGIFHEKSYCPNLREFAFLLSNRNSSIAESLKNMLNRLNEWAPKLEIFNFSAPVEFKSCEIEVSHKKLRELSLKKSKFVKGLSIDCGLVELLDLKESTFSRGFFISNTKIPNLKSFHFDSDSLFLIDLNSFKKLEEIYWVKCQFAKGELLEVISVLGKQLRYLSLGKCTSDINDSDILELAQGAKLLEYIEMERCHNITDAAIESLLSNCPKLRTAKFYFCPRLTKKRCLELAKAYCAKIEPFTQKMQITSISNTKQNIIKESVNYTSWEHGIISS